MGSSSISLQKILAATQGNPDLLDVLTQIKAGATQQEAVTGTTPVSGQIAGQPNPAAPIPAQATGAVSILGGAYVVQLTNPGATNAISALQAAQAAGKATSLTPLQPATPIFHQIRASTSPAFNVNSNTKTFGGNTGSTQTYWTITGLGTGTWYFQFRSSFDGVNFNTWRNANGGTALGGLINEVTEENTGNMNWALFTLPNKLVMGIGDAFVADGEVLDLASQLYSSAMFAIAAANGITLNTIDLATYGITLSDVDIQTPSTPTAGLAVVPDYPVVINMQYGVAHHAPNHWSETASVFAIGYDPTNSNVKVYQQPGGTTSWAVFKLPGGAKIAIGQGKNNDGETIWTPPTETWIDGSTMMSICSFTDATDTGLVPNGVSVNHLSGLTLHAKYNDNSDTAVWSTTANWLAIAWQPGAPVATVGGNTFLSIELQGGHAVVFGAGQTASGTAITLPTGYSVDQMLSICTPASTDMTIHHLLSGIAQCAFIGLTPTLNYEDSNFNRWSGNVNWLLAAWK